MATYHCSIKAGNKGSGASASAKSDYICREGKYSDKPDLEYKESGSLPEWAQDSPRAFWQAGDEHERANGRVYTEIEIALPREITAAKRRELVQNFIHEQLSDHPYTVAIHNPKAALEGGEQPHAHIIFSERKLDGIQRDKDQYFTRAAAPYRDRKTKEMVEPDPSRGGAKKDLSWHKAEKIVEVREAWEQHYNRYSPEKVTCRSLKEQNIDREPERHLGPKMTRSMLAEKTIEIRNDRKELEMINQEIKNLSRNEGIKNEVSVVEIAKAQAERDFVSAGRGDMRTPDEIQQGIELAPEEYTLRSSSQVYDAQREFDRFKERMVKVSYQEIETRLEEPEKQQSAIMKEINEIRTDRQRNGATDPLFEADKDKALKANDYEKVRERQVQIDRNPNRDVPGDAQKVAQLQNLKDQYNALSRKSAENRAILNELRGLDPSKMQSKEFQLTVDQSKNLSSFETKEVLKEQAQQHHKDIAKERSLDNGMDR